LDQPFSRALLFVNQSITHSADMVATAAAAAGMVVAAGIAAEDEDAAADEATIRKPSLRPTKSNYLPR
jgi:hypothetical protein